MTNSTVNEGEYDRRKELEAFDPKTGVKAMVDSGITKVPRIFYHQPEALFNFNDTDGDTDNIIPLIDMSGTHEEVMEKIRNAASTTGFFQVINHGIEVELLDQLTESIRGFFEQSEEEKIKYYNPESLPLGGVGYFSNIEMLRTEKQPGSWRDTLLVRYGPICSDPNAIPPICRSAVMEYGNKVQKLGGRLMSMLLEGLGISPDRQNLDLYLKRADLSNQYYPYCPEPNKTIGIPLHTDAEPMVILLLDQLGGLQIKCKGQWLDFKPVHGALIVNVGDLMQMISNDIYKSTEHRVYANPLHKSRVSVAVFFNPAGDSKSLYGPLPELVTPENPALYKTFRYCDMDAMIKKKELDFETLLDNFRL